LISYQLQSDLRAGHLTETAVLRVLSDILHAVDYGDVAALSALVLLDLSDAFDMVDHDILLQQLHSAFMTSLNDGSNRICQAGRSTYVMDLTSHPLHA